VRTITGRPELRAEDGPLFVVVGVFDGLHLGHAYLLDHLVREARARAARPTVVTFDAHPDAVLLGHAPPLLMDPAERLDRLEGAGVDIVIVEHFDDALRQTPYDAFVGGIADRCAIAGFLMTPDAAFGHDRAGTPTTVGDLGRREGFEVVVVPPFEVDGLPVRSTDIRSAIASGDLASAARLLGRPVAVVGTAIPAVGGARVEFELPVALPPAGVYPVRVEASGTSVSARASLDNGRVELDRDLLGRVRIEFGASADLAGSDGVQTRVPDDRDAGERERGE
jgi:riboflavin kinase/FMN adenylyltransferase